MRFKINQWVALAGDDAVYVGRVKKISIEEKGTKVYVVFGPGDNWSQFKEHELTTATIQINPAEPGVLSEDTP